METIIRNENAKTRYAVAYPSDDAREDNPFSLGRSKNVPADDEDDVISNGYGGVCPRDHRAALADSWIWSLTDSEKC